MNYLDKYIAYLMKGDSDLKGFSKELQDILKKERAENQEQEVKFELEAVEAREVKKSRENYDIFEYTADFIWGFRKDGIFHTTPGDLDTITERIPNEKGTFTFYVDKNTQQVVRISEDIAGNSYGEEVKLKRGASINGCIELISKWFLNIILFMVGFGLILEVIEFVKEIFGLL